MRNQQKDKELIKVTQNNKDCSIQNFHGCRLEIFSYL